MSNSEHLLGCDTLLEPGDVEEVKECFPPGDPVSPDLPEILRDLISEDVGHPAPQLFTDSTAQHLGSQLQEFPAGGHGRVRRGWEVEDETAEQTGPQVSQAILTLKLSLLSLVQSGVIAQFLDL